MECDGCGIVMEINASSSVWDVNCESVGPGAVFS